TAAINALFSVPALAAEGTASFSAICLAAEVRTGNSIFSAREQDNGDSDNDDQKKNSASDKKYRPRRPRPLRRIRRTLRSGNADGRARGTGARIRKSQTRSQVSAAPRPAFRDLRRPPHAAVFRPQSDRKTGRRKNLSQARRSAPHRRTQNQQLPGTSFVG